MRGLYIDGDCVELAVRPLSSSNIIKRHRYSSIKLLLFDGI